MRFAFIMEATIVSNLGFNVKIRKNKGFSLIELIIVIALIGIIAAIAAPNFTRYRDNTNLREAARDVSSDIQLYKQRAIAENVRYRIDFTIGGNKYEIKRETTLNSGDFDTNPNKITKEMGSTNAIETSVPANFGGHSHVTFLPRGTIEENPSSPNADGLTLRHKTRLSTAMINVSKLGRANVQYDLK